MSKKYVFEMTGMPGDTTRVVLNDAVTTLVAQNLHEDADGQVAIGAIITAENEDVRYTFGPSGNNPTQGDGGLGHILFEGATIWLTNPYQIRTIRFINYIAATQSYIMVTPCYEKRPAV